MVHLLTTFPNHKWHIIPLYEEADRRYTGGVISGKHRMNIQFVWD
jgi:hypothetical protein